MNFLGTISPENQGKNKKKQFHCFEYGENESYQLISEMLLNLSILRYIFYTLCINEKKGKKKHIGLHFF